MNINKKKIVAVRWWPDNVDECQTRLLYVWLEEMWRECATWLRRWANSNMRWMLLLNENMGGWYWVDE